MLVLEAHNCHACYVVVMHTACEHDTSLGKIEKQQQQHRYRLASKAVKRSLSVLTIIWY